MSATAMERERGGRNEQRTGRGRRRDGRSTTSSRILSGGQSFFLSIFCALLLIDAAAQIESSWSRELCADEAR